MSALLPFVKMHGAGNDFVMLQHEHVPAGGLKSQEISSLCDRRFGIGADGLIVLGPSPNADFLMTYYNADGHQAEMCGNGARCAVAFAHQIGLAKDSCEFLTQAGLVRGRLVEGEVSVSLPSWSNLKMHLDLTGSPFLAHHFINTGVPHVVIPVADVDSVDLKQWGPKLRQHPDLSPDGANINWVVQTAAAEEFALRTYERGVEDETLACGTGACAVAVVLCKLGLAKSPVALRARSGDRLLVTLNPAAGTGLQLRGPAVISFQGEVALDA